MAARIAVPLALAGMLLGNIQGDGVGRLLDTIGLSQRWNVFAPEPASRRIDLSARVEFAGGGRETWRPPRVPGLDAALGYHWEMWASRVVRDDESKLWAPAARWIARRSDRAGDRVVRVTLRRRWSDVPPPGTRQTPAPQEFDFYTLTIPPGRAP